jgi:hypothetical protein
MNTFNLFPLSTIFPDVLLFLLAFEINCHRESFPVVTNFVNDLKNFKNINASKCSINASKNENKMQTLSLYIAKNCHLLPG